MTNYNNLFEVHKHSGMSSKIIIRLLHQEETLELRLQDLRLPDAPFKESDCAYLIKYVQERRLASREIKVYQLKPNIYDLETT